MNARTIFVESFPIYFTLKSAAKAERDKRARELAARWDRQQATYAARKRAKGKS